MSETSKIDRGYPEQSQKLCAEKLPTGGWCAKPIGHLGACEGVAQTPIDTSTIRPSFAGGLPGKKP